MFNKSELSLFLKNIQRKVSLSQNNNSESEILENLEFDWDESIGGSKISILSRALTLAEAKGRS